MPEFDLFGTRGVTDRWLWWADWAAGLTGDGRVRVADVPHGRTLSLATPGLRYARLVGYGPNYSATEVYPTASGTWADVPGAPTLASVYEDDGTTGLGGWVVRVRPNKGEWRFGYDRAGRTFRSGPCGCTVPRVLTYHGAHVPSTTLGDYYQSPDGMAVTWGPPPSGSETVKNFTVSGSSSVVTMPADAWFSDAIEVDPSSFVSPDNRAYIWIYQSTCVLHIRRLEYAPHAADVWRLDTQAHWTESASTLSTCEPYFRAQFHDSVGVDQATSVSGTHGTDDIVQSAGGHAGDPP